MSCHKLIIFQLTTQKCMIDLSINFAGIKAPNPFWLASAPPTNSGYQIMKAFEAGWGGAVWKTLGVPVVNVSSRYGSIDYRNTRLVVNFKKLENHIDEIYDLYKKWFIEEYSIEKMNEYINKLYE